MLAQSETLLRRSIRRWIAVFIIGLLISGLTAFPIETQLRLLSEHGSWLPAIVYDWIAEVYSAVKQTNAQFPYLSYGTDWLAFAHIVIAVAFVGPFMNPTKNIWVIQFGMIACVMVIPLALIAGEIREIPVFWRIIDCSFGIIGILPLYFTYTQIKRLEKLET